MKKSINYIITLALIICLLTSTTAIAADNTELNPTAGKPSKSTTTTTAPLYGRLSIESVGINVALYNSSSQATCDAVDSACFYYKKGISGMTIADHRHQDFNLLVNVVVGDIAVITQENGGKIYIQCVDFYDGRNERTYLADGNGEVATGLHDFLTYTCLDNNGNIRICQWDIINAENIDPSYDKQFNIDNRTLSKIASYATSNQSIKKNNNKGNSKTSAQTIETTEKKSNGKGKNK